MFCVAASLAALAAAPVPPRGEKEQIEKLWGKVVSPAKECEFRLNGKALVIRDAGQPSAHGLLAEKEIIPRTARTVAGDFEMTVKVLEATPPNREAKSIDSWPWSRAGLYMTGGGFTVEVHLSQYYTILNRVMSESLTRCVWVDSWSQRDGSGSQIANVSPGMSIYLKITRKGNDIAVSHSPDGEKWSAPFSPRQELHFPEEVTAGVFVSHGTYQIVEATFADFKLEREKKKPR